MNRLLLPRPDLRARPRAVAMRSSTFGATHRRPAPTGIDVERLALVSRAQLKLGTAAAADYALCQATDGDDRRCISRFVYERPEHLPLHYGRRRAGP